MTMRLLRRSENDFPGVTDKAHRDAPVLDAGWARIRYCGATATQWTAGAWEDVKDKKNVTGNTVQRSARQFS